MTELINEFYEAMKNEKFDVYGILGPGDKIYTLGTDSKIIGRVFEMFTQPILNNIAIKHNLLIRTPQSQTIYPDFIIMRNEDSTEKIAIDVKTTYVGKHNSTIKFALGSYASYMRNNTKNIEYKYTDYVKHYVIGFVYRRNEDVQESYVYNFNHRHNIIAPYKDIRFFIQEKYKIAGDKPGSGNTENIGSISSTDFNDFKLGRGPFSELGADAFDIYWKYYPKFRTQDKAYTCLNEFFDWLPNHIDDIVTLRPFNRDELLQRIDRYRQAKGL